MKENRACQSKAARPRPGASAGIDPTCRRSGVSRLSKFLDIQLKLAHAMFVYIKRIIGQRTIVTHALLSNLPRE